MMFAAAPQPPVIKGSIPDDYRGPLYYRTVALEHVSATPLLQMLSFKDREPVRKLAGINGFIAAMRKEPKLCDADGALLPEWRQRLRARLTAKARKSWEEYSQSTVTLVSPRVRNIIEAAAPGVHYFVPFDVEDRDGGTLRVDAFFCGVTRRRTALHLEANGISYTLSESGNPLYTAPPWLYTDHFGYLDASVIDGAPLLYDTAQWLLFSDQLVRQLGDVLPKGAAFVPMGVGLGRRKPFHDELSAQVRDVRWELPAHHIILR